MSTLPPVVRTVVELRAFVAKSRSEGRRIGLVPTMGALHHGHLSLIHEISAHADTIITSIFVNPTQFGEGEDFDTYPREEQADLQKLATTKTALVYAPLVTEMYPPGDRTKVSVGGVSERFEGAARPGHFDGVATVVSKLLLQCQPDVAIFGEKDFQQLSVIRQFVRDLAVPTQILGAPIIREPDGLAASSRNIYLTANQRQIAGRFNVILRGLLEEMAHGAAPRTAEQHAAKALMDAGFDAVDYVAIVDPTTLEPIDRLKGEARVLAVARLGKVRLLDNMAIEAP